MDLVSIAVKSIFIENLALSLFLGIGHHSAGEQPDL